MTESYAETMQALDLAYLQGLRDGARKALALVWEGMDRGKSILATYVDAEAQCDRWLAVHRDRLDAGMVVH